MVISQLEPALVLMTVVLAGQITPGAVLSATVTVVWQVADRLLWAEYTVRVTVRSPMSLQVKVTEDCPLIDKVAGPQGLLLPLLIALAATLTLLGLR